MALKPRNPSDRSDINKISKRKNRRTTIKHPKPTKAKKRTKISHTNRPSVVSSDYNPISLAITDLNIPPENRRLVLCDAENIAFNDITGEYSANRIYEAYQWFISNGHDALVLCPDYLLNMLNGPLPSMKLTIDKSSVHSSETHSTNVPYELALLEMANNTEAAIVSERSFNTTYHNFEDVVKNRVIGFTFFRDSIFIPVDPYGRAGPWLNVILHK